jgi:hypothetical protein
MRTGMARHRPTPKSEAVTGPRAHPPPRPRSPAHTDILSLIITSEVNSAAAVHTYTVAARAPLQHIVLREDGWPRRQAAAAGCGGRPRRLDAPPPPPPCLSLLMLQRDAQHGAPRFDEMPITARHSRGMRAAAELLPPITARHSRGMRAAAELLPPITAPILTQ